jgi:membrane fusion protein, multidrug efflux system
LAEPRSGGDAAIEGSRARRSILGASNLLVIAISIAAGLWGLWWLYDRLTNVYVLDARVAADMVLLSSKVSGWVIEVPVSESALVREGDVLLRIDSRRARARLAEQQAAVAVLDANLETALARIDLAERRTRSQLDAAKSRLQAAESELAAAQGDLEVADAEWQRAVRLKEGNLVSQQVFEETRNAFRSATQTARRREAEIATAQADVAVAEADRAEVAVLRSELRALGERRNQAQQQLEQASTDLDDHTITSPTDGVIDQLFIERGEHVAAGQRVLVMHDPDRLWVKANVKETDLRHLAAGSPVTVRVDAYPDARRRGVIRRIGAAATSQFALLPNPNPSGNFTKITQRIEVTIDLDEHDPRLMPGMMVEVKIPRGTTRGTSQAR